MFLITQIAALAKSIEHRHTEQGAGMAEYALLLVLVALALIAGFQGLATGINNALSAVVAAFN